MTSRESSPQHNVSRNAKWAIIQTIVSAGVLFVLYRFLLKELGPEKLGLWSLILASTSIARIGELGFSNATLRFVGKYVGAGNPGAAAEILETSLLTIALPLGVLLAIIIPLLGSVLAWIVPPHHMADALVIVPWAMLALWLGIVGGLVQSAIDGSGRMDQRNMVLIATNGIYLALAIYLTPVLGLKGVAVAQVLQAAASLLIMWWLAKRHLRELPLMPFRWKRVRFKETLGFAVNMQISGIAGMLIDPITKAFISRFAGLEFLAYYEMANQVVNRARGVLMAGFQAMLPTYASVDPSDLDRLRELNRHAETRVLTLGIPYLTLVATAFPLISLIWTGTIQYQLIMCGVLLSVTWVLATIGIPAYYFSVGTGRGGLVAKNQLMMAIMTSIFGPLFGNLYGGYGVVLGAMLALLLATEYMKFRVSNVFSKSIYKNESNGKHRVVRLYVYSVSVGALFFEQLTLLYADTNLQYIISFAICIASLSITAYYTAELSGTIKKT
jgi:O-antigen/teichoic acid export membrane protein